MGEASTFWRRTDGGGATLTLDVEAGHSYELRWDDSPHADPPMEIVDVTD